MEDSGGENLYKNVNMVKAKFLIMSCTGDVPKLGQTLEVDKYFKEGNSQSSIGHTITLASIIFHKQLPKLQFTSSNKI